MDPVSAVGVAAAAMQFLDFGLRLLSTSYDIYKSPSGRTAKQVTLSTIVDDLTDLLDQTKDTTSAGYAYTSPAEEQLLRLSKECKALVAPLHEALGRLRKAGPTEFTFEEPQSGKEKSIRKTLRAALKSVWEESEIDETIGKLDKMKRRMMTATLLALWAGSKQSRQREIQFSKRLDEMVALLRQIGSCQGGTGQEATANHQDLSEPGFRDEDTQSPEHIIRVLNDTHSLESRRIYDELVIYLWGRQWSPQQPEWPNAAMDAAAMRSIQAAFQASVIRSLDFDTIRLRQETIEKAFEDTFSWVFQTGSTDTIGWPSFPAWLESDVKEPYWITGKPGSGKSTLMKFVLEHPSLLKHLTVWASGIPLLITSYYAWVAGSSMQKSRKGLMRTLLHQCLQKNPSLVAIVAPRRWALFTTLRSVVKMPPWPQWEIDESFETLLSQCSKTVKLALFVDGLDELESPPVQIIDFIQNLNARSGIKICVASRQWTEFNDAFKGNPMFRMQDLTTPGMTHYVKVKLEGNPGFLELGKVFPTETSNLINEIIKKSSGVFLWVSIVVKALLGALTEGDGLPELQATIDQLPSDIAQLYDAIWARIEDRNVSKSSELLAVVRAAYGPLSYLTLWLADKRQSPAFDISSLPPEATAGIADLMKRRLDSRTRGILEISPNGTVEFLHRTARDWVSTPEVWERISSGVEEPFDPYLLLLQAETVEITNRSYIRNGTDARELLWAIINRSLYYAAHVRDTTDFRTKLTHFLDMFDNRIDKVVESYIDLSRWYSQVQGTQVRPHWSSCQTYDPLGDYKNTFLGLTAQFCIIPYLREKTVSYPNAMKQRVSKANLSLLENAVFGYYPGVTYPDGNLEDEKFHISGKKRLETIAFLLEHGASPKQEMVNGSLVINEVRKKKATERGPAEDRYWVKVESLLAPKRESTMKSIVSFRRGRKS